MGSSLARLGVVAAVLLSCAAINAQQPDPGMAELADAVQRHYQSVRDFSADFVHTYRGGILKTRLTERGRVVIKKPGKMRWEYVAPEEKLFVSDGVKLYSYVPEDRQVMVRSVPQRDEATTSALFLAGKGNLTRDFVVSAEPLPAGMPAGSVALKLVPRVPQAEYDAIVLCVEPRTFRFVGLGTVDAQGGTSTFAFTNLKENTGIADKTFAFKIPRGADVLSDAAR
jgi:outer membrane lipoprotein carrier protein